MTKIATSPTPFLVRDPGLAGFSNSTAEVSRADLAPTFRAGPDARAGAALAAFEGPAQAPLGRFEASTDPAITQQLAGQLSQQALQADAARAGASRRTRRTEGAGARTDIPKGVYTKDNYRQNRGRLKARVEQEALEFAALFSNLTPAEREGLVKKIVARTMKDMDARIDRGEAIATKEAGNDSDPWLEENGYMSRTFYLPSLVNNAGMDETIYHPDRPYSEPVDVRPPLAKEDPSYRRGRNRPRRRG